MDLFGFMKRTTRWMRSYSISSVNGSYTSGCHGSLATSDSLMLKFPVSSYKISVQKNRFTR